MLNGCCLGGEVGGIGGDTPLSGGGRSFRETPGSPAPLPLCPRDRGLTAGRSRTPCPPPDPPATECSDGALVMHNELLVKTFPHKKTGYKDSNDYSNRTDKRNGGTFETYQSLYTASHGAVEGKPIKFRSDGIPISARRVKGIPLMCPKLPSQAELTAGQKLKKKYSKSTISLGNPNVRDPKHYKSISKLMYPKHKRALYSEANPGIAADESKRSHHRVWN